MKKIGIVTPDDFLFQKIKLALRDIATCKRVNEGTVEHFDFTFVHSIQNGTRRLSVSGIRETSLTFPLSIENIRSLLSDEGDKPTLTLSEREKSVIFGQRSIRLTELEYAMLSLLVEKRGDFASREELLANLWGKGTDAGVVNVYIHYLREKLECEGEKVIISSRKQGYKIDKRFLGGSLEC